MNWSFAALFAKAKLYMERADEEDANSPLFPFWASLSLEFLCRAALSAVHPSLLADPREGSNLLYACGIEVKTAPKSIPAKTVFDRCQSVRAAQCGASLWRSCVLGYGHGTLASSSL
jgi:hypothetical protein